MSDHFFKMYGSAFRDAVITGCGAVRVSLATPPCEFAAGATAMQATKGADGVWTVELEKTDG